MPSESYARVSEDTKEIKLGWLVKVQYQLQDKTRQGNLTRFLQSAVDSVLQSPG